MRCYLIKFSRLMIYAICADFIKININTHFVDFAEESIALNQYLKTVCKLHFKKITKKLKKCLHFYKMCVIIRA